MIKNKKNAVIAAILIGVWICLSGCTTGVFRVKITPMKIEINAPDTQKSK